LFVQAAGVGCDKMAARTLRGGDQAALAGGAVGEQDDIRPGKER
jgi:hypothetical protein